MVRSSKGSTAFTLLEVILAVSLTGVVLLLLTTSLHLLLYQVETSRWRVESSQLARGVLNQFSADLRAARYYAPKGYSPGEGSSDSENGDSGSGVDSLRILGIYGSKKELRIDRAAVWQWQRLSQEDQYDEAEGATAEDMPQTVRYFLSEGERVQVGTYAAEGITGKDPPPEYAGLSRQRMSTAAWVSQADSEDPEASSDNAVLIAPEVLDVEFSYFDGEEMLDEWDSAEQGELPKAVEITLKLEKETIPDLTKRPPLDLDDQEPDLEAAIEYRVLVRIPRTRPRTDIPGPLSLE